MKSAISTLPSLKVKSFVTNSKTSKTNDGGFTWVS